MLVQLIIVVLLDAAIGLPEDPKGKEADGENLEGGLTLTTQTLMLAMRNWSKR